MHSRKVIYEINLEYDSHHDHILDPSVKHFSPPLLSLRRTSGDCYRNVWLKRMFGNPFQTAF